MTSVSVSNLTFLYGIMTSQSLYSVLVNTSDGYEDCWMPFFRLLHQHWPECPQPVYLNTEVKQWRHENVDICALQVQTASTLIRRLTWSECLLAALEQIPTELVVYFQEDYFISRPVDSTAIDRLAQKMHDDLTIKHIGLTHFGSQGPFHACNDPRLKRIDRKARYRISTQAGLWRVDTLRSYLLKHENAWEFEIFGTLRARARNDLFLTVNRDESNPQARLIDYSHTGILKKKWNRQIPALFSQFGIEIDYSRRGFYDEPTPLLRKLETFRTLCRNPHKLWKLLGYMSL